MTYGAFDGDGLVAYVVTSTLPRDPILSGCIVDIVCRDADEIREFALSRAVGELRAAGVHVVECLATRPEYRRALIGCGFLERPSPTSLLFHVNDAEGHPGFDGAADLSGWHVTYADSDCLTVVQRDLLTATPVAAG